MKRLIRSTLISVVLAACVAGALAQQIPQALQERSPIPPNGQAFFTIDNILSEDGKTVREFFQFTCPYCRQMHASIWNWGASLPKSLIFEPTPIVTEDVGTVIAAAAFYSVYLIAPGKLGQFSTEIYALVQDRNMSLRNPEIYFIACRALKIDTKAFNNTSKSDKVRSLVERAAVLAGRYRVINTPTLAIGGRYTINPEIVEGDPRKFIHLANLVTSKHLQGM